MERFRVRGEWNTTEREEFLLFGEVKRIIRRNTGGDIKKFEKELLELSKKVLHDKALLEFKRRYEKVLGEIILTNDPLGNEEVDTIIDSSKGNDAFKFKINDVVVKGNIKRQVPFQIKPFWLGISRWYYEKYKNTRTYLIFALPNSYFYNLEKNSEKKGIDSVEEHKFFLLNFKKAKIKRFAGWFCVDYRELYDFELILKGQTLLEDYIKND